MIRRILLAILPLAAFISFDAPRDLHAQGKGKSQPAGGFGLTGGLGGSSNNANRPTQTFQKPAGGGGGNFNLQQSPSTRTNPSGGFGLTAGSGGSNGNSRPNGLGLTGGSGGSNFNPGSGGSAFNPRPGGPNTPLPRNPGGGGSAFNGAGGSAFNPGTQTNTTTGKTPNSGGTAFAVVAGGGGSQNPRPVGAMPGGGGSGGNFAQHFGNFIQNNSQPLFQPQNQVQQFQPQNQPFQPQQFQPQNQQFTGQGVPAPTAMPGGGSAIFNPVNQTSVPQPGSAAGTGGSAFNTGEQTQMQGSGFGGSAFNAGVPVNATPVIHTLNRRNLKMRNDTAFPVTVSLQYHTYVLGEPQWRPLNNGRLEFVLRPGELSYVTENGFRISADEVKFSATLGNPEQTRETRFLNEPLFLGQPNERVDGKLSYQNASTLLGTHTHVFR